MSNNGDELWVINWGVLGLGVDDCVLACFVFLNLKVVFYLFKKDVACIFNILLPLSVLIISIN